MANEQEQFLLKVALDLSQPVAQLDEYKAKVREIFAEAARIGNASGGPQGAAQLLGATQAVAQNQLASLTGKGGALEQSPTGRTSANASIGAIAQEVLAAIGPGAEEYAKALKDNAAAFRTGQALFETTLDECTRYLKEKANLLAASNKAQAQAEAQLQDVTLQAAKVEKLAAENRLKNAELDQPAITSALAERQRIEALSKAGVTTAFAESPGAQQALQTAAAATILKRDVAHKAALQAVRAADEAEASTTSIFQKMYASLKNASAVSRSGTGANLITSGEAPTLGGFIGSRIFTTASYAGSAALLFGLGDAVKEAVQDRADLEKIFNQIESEFEGLGKPELVSGFIRNIKDISKETGQATQDVAHVAFQFQGAFQDTAKAITETRAASELSRLTSLPVAEITDSLTAITTSYEKQGVTIRDIGDVALGLQEKFGVLGKETITFAADLAPVAAAAGFTSSQLEVLGAVAQKFSGQTGSSLAERFARIIPAVTDNAVKFIDFFKSIPDLADKVPDLGKAFGKGDVQQVIDIIGRSYSKLNDAQKAYIEELLGGSRNAQAIIPVLRNYNEVLEANGETIGFAGKQNEYFARFQDTLVQKTARLEQTLRLLGVSIVDSGFGDFLKYLIDVSTFVVHSLDDLVSVFTRFNEALGGMPSKLVGVAIAMTALVAALRAMKVEVAELSFAKIGSGIGDLASSVLSQTRFGAAGGLAAPSAASRLLAPPGATVGLGTAEEATAAAGVASFEAGGAGLASGVLAAFTNPVTITALGITMGALYVHHLNEGVKKGSEEAISSLAGTDKKFNPTEQQRLRDIATQTAPDLDLFGVGLQYGGGPNARDVKNAQQAYNKLVDPILAQKVQALADADLLPDSIISSRKTTIAGITVDSNKQTFKKGTQQYTEYVNNLIKTLTDNTASGTDVEDLLGELGKENPALKGFLDAWKPADQLEADAQATDDAFQNDVQAAKAAYQSGRIGIARYLQTIKDEIDSIKEIKGPITPAEAQLLSDLQSQYSTTISDAVLKEVQNRKKIRDIFGHANAKDDVQDLKTQLSVLNENPVVNADAIFETRLEIINAIKGILQDQISTAKTAAEKAALGARGINIDDYAPGLRLADLLDQLNRTNYEFQIFVSQQSKTYQDNSEVINNAIAHFVLEEGKTVDQAIVLALQRNIATLQNVITNTNEQLGPEAARLVLGNVQTRLAAYQAALSAAANQHFDITPLDNKIKIDQSPGADKSGDALAKRIQEAQDKYEEALVGKNPLKLAELHQTQAVRHAKEAKDEADRINAKTDALKANDEVRDAIVAIYESYDDLLIAQDKANKDIHQGAVDAARDAISKAQLVLDYAKDHGDQTSINAAQSQLVATQKQLQDALIDQASSLFDAQLGLSTAMDEAAGRTVAAAGDALAGAQHALEVANQKGDPNGILAAQAGLVRQQASLRDAKLQDSEDTIQFALDMEQITTDQAIAQFQALLSIPDLTLAQTRDIRRKIKELQGQTSKDLQYDLPTEIAMPTLYDAAVHNTGYVDSRNIMINVYQSGGNVTDTVNQIANVVNSPPRYGTQGQIY